jgi:hypothetical protein
MLDLPGNLGRRRSRIQDDFLVEVPNEPCCGSGNADFGTVMQNLLYLNGIVLKRD